MLIRRERPGDVDAIDEVHRRAFVGEPAGSEPVEVGLVRALRADRGWVPALSLVAEDGAGNVVGHVVGSLGAVEDVAVVGLGPVGVVPERQGSGVGHSDYYPRFGFVGAAGLGILPPDPTWGEHFQARTLAAYTPDLRGTFRYAVPFEAH